MVNFFSSQEVASLDLDVTLYQLMQFFHGQGTLLDQIAWQREWLGIIGNEYGSFISCTLLLVLLLLSFILLSYWCFQ